MKETKDLAAILKELKTELKRASVDLEAVPWQTRPSVSGMVQAAKVRVEALRTDYAAKLRSNTLGLFVSGEPERVKKFIAIAEVEASTPVIDADGLYGKLADQIEPSISPNREFSATQLQGLIQKLRPVMDELGIRWMNMPSLTDTPAVPNRAALIEQIRKLVRGAVGDELLRLWIAKKMVDEAIERDFSGKLYAVIVTNTTSEEALSLASAFTYSNSVSVGTDETGEVNNEFVLNQLKAVKKALGIKK